MPVESFDAVVVGGGPAGLATSQQLGMRGISNVVLERGGHAGWMWGHVYDGLRLHTGKHLSALPGMSFPAQTSLFPTLSEFTSYVARYADRFALPIRACTEVTGLRQDNGAWVVETTRGEYSGEIRGRCDRHHDLPCGPGLRWDFVLRRADIPQHGISATQMIGQGDEYWWSGSGTRGRRLRRRWLKLG